MLLKQRCLARARQKPVHVLEPVPAGLLAFAAVAAAVLTAGRAAGAAARTASRLGRLDLPGLRERSDGEDEGQRKKYECTLHDCLLMTLKMRDTNRASGA